jgi:hypothetical protein
VGGVSVNGMRWQDALYFGVIGVIVFLTWIFAIVLIWGPH